MAIRKWYVDQNRNKVTLSPGTLAEDVFEIVDNSDDPYDQLRATVWHSAGSVVSSAETDAANAAQSADPVPALREPPAPVPDTDPTRVTTADLAAAMDVEAGKEIASSTLATHFTPTDNTQQDIPGWAVTVPANSGPANVTVVGGVLVNVTTGLIAATTSQRASLYLVDEANTIVGEAQVTVYGTGVSQTLVFTLPLGAAVPNATVDKTYRVQCQVQRLGTSGATGAFGADSPFPPVALQAVRR